MMINKRINISLILFLGMLAVSTSPVAAKILNQSNEVEGIMIAFWRMAFASIILWLFSFFSRQGSFKSYINFNSSILSGIFLGFHFALFFVALDLTKIANATFLGTLTPVFTLILEITFLKRKFTYGVYLGLVCALLGAFIIFLGAPLDVYNNDMLGNFFALMCSFVLAISFLISEKVRQTESTIVYTRTLYTSATITLFIVALIFEKNIFPNHHHQNIYLGFVYLGLVPTIVGHNAFYYSLKYIKPTIIAAVPLAEPIIASIICWFLFPILSINDQLILNNWEYTIIGGIISLVGIFFVIKNRN